MRSRWYFPKIRGTQYRPQNTIILSIGTPKKVPPNFGKLPDGEGGLRNEGIERVGDVGSVKVGRCLGLRN